MTNPKDSSFACPHCGADVEADDDFCADCGEIFAENVVCSRHEDKPATGVCIVCGTPYCSNCGGRVQNRFLCSEHDKLEIYEGMARVFGSRDAVQVRFAESSLKEAGLHPFVYSRKANAISLGAPEYTLFSPAGDYDGHFVNEFKLMVPCQEVQRTEKKLRELHFIE